MAPTNATNVAPNNNVVAINQGFSLNTNPPISKHAADTAIKVVNLSALLMASSSPPA